MVLLHTLLQFIFSNILVFPSLQPRSSIRSPVELTANQSGTLWLQIMKGWLGSLLVGLSVFDGCCQGHSLQVTVCSKTWRPKVLKQ